MVKKTDLVVNIGESWRIIDELIKLAIREHYYCEDEYYTCPAHPDGVMINRDGSRNCNCGADQHNAKVAALAEQLKK